MSSQTCLKEFAEKLLSWWSQNKRDFPWRATSDPYRILIAELLLRKTTARQVEKLYEKFLLLYPSPEALSRAPEEQLESLIRPLGMERKRASLLKKLADELVRRFSGRVPASKEELMSLPGVGLYTANAVLCFAYGMDVPIVDTNVARVFQRVFGLRPRKSRPRDDPWLWDFVASVIPRSRAREFNLAIIDFAHAICRLRNPRCSVCPLSGDCKYAGRLVRTQFAEEPSPSIQTKV